MNNPAHTVNFSNQSFLLKYSSKIVWKGNLIYNIYCKNIIVEWVKSTQIFVPISVPTYTPKAKFSLNSPLPWTIKDWTSNLNYRILELFKFQIEKIIYLKMTLL